MSYLHNLAKGGFNITPSDDADLPSTAYGIDIGADGDISFVTIDGSSITKTVTGGSILLYKVRKVNATGTTATGLIGLKGN